MPKSKPFLLTSQLIILHNMYNGRVATKKVDRLFKGILLIYSYPESTFKHLIYHDCEIMQGVL